MDDRILVIGHGMAKLSLNIITGLAATTILIIFVKKPI